MVYLSVDIEASGPFPGIFSLVSIGAVVVRSNSSGQWWADDSLSYYAELQPLEGAAELEAATNIHKLTREYLLEHGRPPKEVMEEFALYFKDLEKRFKKVIPAAWPSSFDSPFLGWYLQYFTGDNPIGWSAFDIPSYGMGLFRCHRNALRSLMKKAGIEFGNNPNPHNALADAFEQGQTMASLLNHARQLRKEKSRTAT